MANYLGFLKNVFTGGSGLVKKGVNLAASKSPTLAKALGIGAGNQAAKGTIKRAAQKGARNLAVYAPGVATYSGAQALLGDSGPSGDEFEQRAINQLRYGVDMTDEQMQEAMDNGQDFQDTGAIGEGGLNEAQVRQYIRDNAEHRGGLQRTRDVVADIGGFFNPILAAAAIYNDSNLGKNRVANLNNIVGKLRLDANEGNIRRNMEGTMGRFMTEGLMGEDFGRGKVRNQGKGEIKSPVDPKAKKEQEEALKEYEAIKARDGVFAAIGSPAAAKAGRQVYLDVQEASGGDKDTAEALLSGAGLTDQATTERYYGNPKENAANNYLRMAEAVSAAAAKQTAAEAGKPASPSLSPQRSGELNLNPAKNADEVRANQEAIATSGGFYGQSPVGVQQTAYLNANGMKSARQLEEAMGSDPAWRALAARHGKALEANRQKFIEARAAGAEKEYDKFIVKPGDANYGLRKPGERQDTAAESDAWYQAALARARGQKVPLPGQVNAAAPAPATPAPTPATPAPISAQVNASANAPAAPVTAPAPAPVPAPNQPAKPAPTTTFSPTPYGIGTASRGTGLPQLPDIGAAARSAGEAIGNAVFPQSLPGQGPSPMRPTPYGLGTATPGIPRIPDIGAPARRAGEAMGNAVFPQSIPAKPQGPMSMGASSYGLGTATPGIPRVPDIGAAARTAGENIMNNVLPQSLPGNPAAKKPMSQEEIAKMLAADQAAEATRRSGTKMPAPGGPSPRFNHPTQRPNNRPY